MRERPILFSGPMVRAILEGRKSQTRRAVKPQPSTVDEHGRWYRMPSGGESLDCYPCPYGVPGDRLWVRETWHAEDALDDLPPRCIPPGGPIWYSADNSLRGLRGILHSGKTRPGMFMPRWASRLTLEVTGVRVERLQDISEADAVSEGVDCIKAQTPTERDAYRYLWDDINGTGSWAANPWVWMVEFKRAA